MISDIAGFLIGGVFAIGSFLVGLLPVSPIPDLSSYLSGTPVALGLGWLNWFVDVGTCVGIGIAWAACMVAYFVYRFFSGWLRDVLK